MNATIGMYKTDEGIAIGGELFEERGDPVAIYSIYYSLEDTPSVKKALFSALPDIIRLAGDVKQIHFISHVKYFYYQRKEITSMLSVLFPNIEFTFHCVRHVRGDVYFLANDALARKESIIEKLKED